MSGGGAPRPSSSKAATGNGAVGRPRSASAARSRASAANRTRGSAGARNGPAVPGGVRTLPVACNEDTLTGSRNSAAAVVRAPAPQAPEGARAEGLVQEQDSAADVPAAKRARSASGGAGGGDAAESADGADGGADCGSIASPAAPGRITPAGAVDADRPAVAGQVVVQTAILGFPGPVVPSDGGGAPGSPAGSAAPSLGAADESSGVMPSLSLSLPSWNAVPRQFTQSEGSDGLPLTPQPRPENEAGSSVSHTEMCHAAASVSPSASGAVQFDVDFVLRSHEVPLASTRHL